MGREEEVKDFWRSQDLFSDNNALNSREAMLFILHLLVKMYKPVLERSAMIILSSTEIA